MMRKVLEDLGKYEGPRSTASQRPGGIGGSGAGTGSLSRSIPGGIGREPRAQSKA